MVKDYGYRVRDDECKTFSCNPVKSHAVLTRRNFNAADVTNALTMIIDLPNHLSLSANGKWGNLISMEQSSEEEAHPGGISCLLPVASDILFLKHDSKVRGQLHSDMTHACWVNLPSASQ